MNYRIDIKSFIISIIRIIKYLDGILSNAISAAANNIKITAKAAYAAGISMAFKAKRPPSKLRFEEVD